MTHTLRMARLNLTDPTLAQWGANIARQRKAMRAVYDDDGNLIGTAPRMSGDDVPLSQEQLGQLLDPPVVQSTITRWENGVMEPRRHYKNELARRLYLSTSLLFPLAAA